MKEKKEQISNELMNELLRLHSSTAKKIYEIIYKKNYKYKDKWGKIKKLLKKDWIYRKLIKQSREEEIREKIKNYEKSVCYPNKETAQYEYMQYQKELIEILDNKAKNK